VRPEHAELVQLAIDRARALRRLLPGTRGRRRQDLEQGAQALEVLAEGVLELDLAGQRLADAINEAAALLAVERCPHCRPDSDRTPASRGQGDDAGAVWWHDGEGGELECAASDVLELRERVAERLAASATTTDAARRGAN
jgi:hypothetical protein